MAVECYISTTYTPFSVVNSYIDVWKRTFSSIVSYGICAEFAKLVSRRARDPGLSSVIRAARKYSKGAITLDKFERVIADADTGDAHDNYIATIGMLTAAVYRGCIEETVNIVIFIMCAWHDVSFNDAYKRLIRVIEKVNKEYRKMSWNGYEVTVCENAHIVTLDPHADTGNKCPTCGGKVVQYFQFDCTNGDEAESRHNKRKWQTVNRVAAKILRSNPEEIERRIKDVQKRKDKFLKGIQNTLNNYDKEIESLRGMLEARK